MYHGNILLSKRYKFERSTSRIMQIDRTHGHTFRSYVPVIIILLPIPTLAHLHTSDRLSRIETHVRVGLVMEKFCRPANRCKNNTSPGVPAASPLSPPPIPFTYPPARPARPPARPRSRSKNVAIGANRFLIGLMSFER